MAQLPDPGLNGYSVRHQATPDNRLSYTLRSGIPDRLSMGASEGVGLASALSTVDSIVVAAKCRVRTYSTSARLPRRFRRTS